MPPESENNLRLEIGHVLFIDLVGYSKLLIEEQKERLGQLTEIVLATAQVREAPDEQLVRLPTGDGMALVFHNSSEEPARCALEIAEALKKHPEIPVRMGIHSGPVSEVTDVSGRTNIAGAGINMAQRVMDCGDAGHILLSRRVAEDLAEYRQWAPRLHDLGECEVKHGVKLHLTNLFGDDFGNSAVPGRLAAPRRGHKGIGKFQIGLALLASLLLLAAGIGLVRLNTGANRSPASAAETAPEKSIAVLPLENLSAKQEDAFFADGIQDDVLTSLASIRDLKVISRTSVMQYRGKGAARNLRDIARELGVKNILEGSVRRAGNRVLVNVQLIDTANDRHIWAERYDRTIADSLGLQGELATQIARALQAKLAPEEKTSLGTKPTNSPEAYVFYLRARDLEQNAETNEDLLEVEKLYAQAIALDPSFALAHARASIRYSKGFADTLDPALKARARSQAEEALRLSPSLGEAHLALGRYFQLTEKNYPAALEQLTVALTALPNNVEVLQDTARIYRLQGRWREAIAGFAHARSLNPNENPGELVRTYWMVRDWPAAAAIIQRNLAQASVFPYASAGLSQIEIVANRNLPAARARLREIPTGMDPKGIVTLANWNLSMLGRDFASAEKWLAGFPGDEFPEFPISQKSFFQAQSALARGDVALAQVLFEKIRPALENDVRNRPEDARPHALLGILYGYMGMKADAIRESRRAVELCPVSTDAVEGAEHESELALVYALTGEKDQAFILIERLLRTPGASNQYVSWFNALGGITQAELALRWQWDKLRGDSRFKKLLDGPEPKTIY